MQRLRTGILQCGAFETSQRTSRYRRGRRLVNEYELGMEGLRVPGLSNETYTTTLADTFFAGVSKSAYWNP